jgi:SAM-dependent methyltransferase
MQYEGSELELFADARNWKSYVRDRISPYISGNVLEVGAGIGAFTEFLAGPSCTSWTCLEPDPALLAEIPRRQESGRIARPVSTICGTLADIPAGDRFDTIIYLDVMEHILDDTTEAQAAAAKLAPGGHLIILVPAFQFAYSPFDAAIGHHRRYDRPRLEQIRPNTLTRITTFYMDAPGLTLSLANRMLLKSASPGKDQIKFWDTTIVPIARILDPILARSFGRSLVAVWRNGGEVSK